MTTTINRSQGMQVLAEGPREIKARQITELTLQLDRLKAVRRHYSDERDAITAPGRPRVVEDAFEVRQDILEFILQRISVLTERIRGLMDKLAELGSL